MKKILLIATVCSAIFGFSSCTKCSLESLLGNQKEEIKRLELDVSKLKEEIIPIKFQVSYENGNANIVLKYLNQEGNTVKKVSHAIKGSEVFFDFRVVPIDSKNNLFFPYCIYSNEVSLIEGISLVNDYVKDGFPEIYKDLDAENLKLIAEHFESAMQSQMSGKTYGNSIHDSNDFNIHFMPNETYKILCHKEKGGIDISMD